MPPAPIMSHILFLIKFETCSVQYIEHEVNWLLIMYLCV